MLARLANGRSLLVAGQKSGMVYALDPDQKGEIVWQSASAGEAPSAECSGAWQPMGIKFTRRSRTSSQSQK
jgi:hypothetical protein